MRDLFEVASLFFLFALGTGLVVLVGMAILRWQEQREEVQWVFRPTISDEAILEGTIQNLCDLGAIEVDWLDSDLFAGNHPHGWPRRAWFYDQERDG